VKKHSDSRAAAPALLLIGIMFLVTSVIGCAGPNYKPKPIAPAGADNQYVLSDLGLQIEVPSSVWNAYRRPKLKDTKARPDIFFQHGSVEAYVSVQVLQSYSVLEAGQRLIDQIIEHPATYGPADFACDDRKGSFVVNYIDGSAGKIVIMKHPAGDERIVIIQSHGPKDFKQELFGAVDYLVNTMRAYRR